MISTRTIVRTLESLLANGKSEKDVATLFVHFVERFKIEARVPQILRELAESGMRQSVHKMLVVWGDIEPSVQQCVVMRNVLGAPPQTPVTFVKDAHVLAGMRATYGDTYIDASAARQIARVHGAISNR